jgi:hypothetical protein
MSFPMTFAPDWPFIRAHMMVLSRILNAVRVQFACLIGAWHLTLDAGSITQVIKPNNYGENRLGT